ncbi:MAG: carbon-nitrogen hydrolase family protein [Calditrichaeota bacterium]|nr:carbon-nitrogen hydrolase family protein [Calditrichota bacterium]
MAKTIRVAIVQARPVYYQLEKSLSLALERIESAAQNGARLVVFGETWLPGYPAWLDHCPGAALWNHPPTKAVYARLRENSVAVPGKETRLLAQAAADLRVVLVMGINEQVEKGPGNNTLYNSILIFDADGRLINHHRKLMPTYTEKLIWGLGDARGLRAVDSAVGRIGGLICWEHWMPLSRQKLHLDGEAIHVALWPTVHDMHQIASRHYAFEGRCFVLAAGSILRASDLPAELELTDAFKRHPDALVLRGGSAIIAPDGSYLMGPMYDRETIMMADLDLDERYREGLTLDVSGHYHRPDIFQFSVNTDPL